LKPDRRFASVAAAARETDFSGKIDNRADGSSEMDGEASLPVKLGTALLVRESPCKEFVLGRSKERTEGFMKLISVNVGLPREVSVSGKTVRTSIWKDPVQGRVHVSTLNLGGDQQSDLSVHGGVDKAVYLYPSEHYSYWRTQLSEVALPWGAFGENFTTEGILEDQVKVGDRIRIGSAEFMVTQPRMPCYKLGIRFDRRDMVKRFLESKRTGLYLAVLREGEVEEGDEIDFIEKQESGVTITEIVNLYSTDSQN
jgi:MOSC domain-containing protein YiiM